MFPYKHEFFGSNVIWFMGVCEDSSDPLDLGRIKARIFGWHTEKRTDLPTDDLPWAMVVQPPNGQSNSGVGLHARIQPGTWVIGFWADGEDAQQPIIMGCIPGVHKPNPAGYGNSDGIQGQGMNSSGKHHGDSFRNPGSSATTLPNAVTHGSINDDGSMLQDSDFPAGKGTKGPLRYYTNGPSRGNNGLGCKDGQFKIHRATAMALEALTDKNGGRPFAINSAYRSPSYNASVGGARNSQHTHGRAFDISKSSIGNLDQFIKNAIECGFVSFGHYNSFIHIDTRAGGGTAWSGGGMSTGEWIAKLQANGWRQGMKPKFKGGLPQTNSPPSPSTTSGTTTEPLLTSVSSIGASQFTTPYYTLGFRDPTNSWPTTEYRGQPSTNFLARGVTDDKNSFPLPTAQETARAGGFMTPTGATWSTPGSAYAAQKGHNTVLASRNAALELDDSPGAARVALTHKSGTHTEIDVNGGRVDATVGDAYRTDNKNSYHGVLGDFYGAYNGGWNIATRSEMNLKAIGDVQILTEGDATLTSHGDFKLLSGDTIKIRAKTLIFDGIDMHFFAKNGMYFEAGEELHIKAKGVKVKADDAMNVQSKGFTVNSTAPMELKGTRIDAKADGVVNIEAGGTMNLKGSDIKSTPVITLGASGAVSAGDVTVKRPKNADDLADSLDDLKRSKIQNRPSSDSTKETRPGFSTMQGAGTSGVGRNTRPESGDFNMTGAAKPGTDKNITGGTEDESHTEPRGIGIDGSNGGTTGSGFDQSLTSSEGVQNYVNQIYPQFRGGKVNKPSQDLVDGINRACRELGFPPGLAFLIAAYESDFRNVGNSSTSASGFFQLTNAAMTDVNKFASQNGLSTSGGGSYGQAKSMIIYLMSQKPTVEKSIGRKVKVGEMYLIHFLGAGGASNCIKQLESNPNGANTVPERGNRSEVYNNHTGEKRTWKEFYDRQMRKFTPAGPYNIMVPDKITRDA